MNSIKNKDSIVRSKPTSPGVRARKKVVRSEVTYFGRPEKKLISKRKLNYGINNMGRNTSRGRKKPESNRGIRLIDWKRSCTLEGVVERIEIDPNRSANIALISYPNGLKQYILSPVGLMVGSKIVRSDEKVDISPGNATKLVNIPSGTSIHCIEQVPHNGASLVRTAGGSAKVLSQVQDKYTKVEFPSKEVKLLSNNCLATIGTVGNVMWNKQNLGKAGNSHYNGRRSIVRGSAMNPCDHPHGGGEGKQKLGRKNPVNKNGKPMFGITRKSRKPNNRFILSNVRKFKLSSKK